jgi:hypothetical protein
VTPPIGWNRITNPGFEYGMWPAIAPAVTTTTVSPHSGNSSARMVVSSAQQGYYYAYSNKVNCAGIATIVVGGWFKGTIAGSIGSNPAPYHVFTVYRHSTPTDITWDGNAFIQDFGLVTTLTPCANWTEFSATIALTDLTRPWITLMAPHFCNASGTLNIDDCYITFGNQKQAYTDFTIAKDKWMPDSYYSKESSTLTSSGVGGTVSTLSINCTLDYAAKAFIWAGAKISQCSSISGTSTDVVNWECVLRVNGTIIGTDRGWQENKFPSAPSTPWQLYMHSAVICDEATLNAGVNTIRFEIGNYGTTPRTLSSWDRYIRVIAGSWFQT